MKNINIMGQQEFGTAFKWEITDRQTDNYFNNNNYVNSDSLIRELRF